MSEVEMASRSSPIYTIEILRLAASLQEPRALEREDGHGEARSATCGSRIATVVQLENGRVASLSQEVHACAFGQASAALVEREAVGRSPIEIEAALEEVSRWLAGGPEPAWDMAALTPALSRSGRHGAIILPLRALIAAIEDAK